MAATALRADLHDRKNMDRTAALFFGVGAILSLATLTMPAWEGRETRYLAILWGLALIDGLFVWEKAGKLPDWFHHVNIGLLTLVITGGIIFNGSAGPAFAVFYVAGAIYSFFFFGRGAALTQIGWIALCYALALLTLDQGLGMSYARWLMMIGIIIVTGGAIGWLTEQIRTMAALEHELKEEADAARATADKANLAKSEFLSRMSHELRTPLNAVLGFAQVLEMDDLEDDQKESVSQINKAGQHLLELINEVLDLSRIEAGRLSLSIEPVKWAEALEECMTLIRPLAAERQLSIVAQTEPAENTFVKADRQRLKQVFLNLLSNAVKYNSDAGSIMITADPNDGFMRISITDTGAGIPADRFDELFAPFKRLDADETAIEGSGLGLAVTKRLVEAMGGRISVTSKIDQGSTFSVEFEICSGVEESAGPMAAAASVAPVAGGSEVAILYIEDNLANLKLIERLLADRPNVELLSSLHAADGIQLAREYRPDLILLDLNLPDVDGDEVIARLREDPTTAPIPIVMITADASPGQAQRLIEAGAFDYLTKPIDVNKFFKVIDDALEVEVS